MSRGLSDTQVRLLAVLAEGHRGEWVAVERTHLKDRASPGGDKSNARRALRGLLDRGLVLEMRDDESGLVYYFPSYSGAVRGTLAAGDEAGASSPSITGYKVPAVLMLHHGGLSHNRATS